MTAPRYRLWCEALEDRRLLACGDLGVMCDFGDAPAHYGTDLAMNGARHSGVGPRLGNARDVEPNGTPSLAGTADGIDEDGVTFGSLVVGQLGATVLVTVANAPDGARLDAWVDFNRDGQWSGREELIADSAPVVEGENTIRFGVPGHAVPGKTFARFRLSSNGRLGPRGFAPDGEVEDHGVSIAAAGRVNALFGEPTVIDTNESLFTIPGDIDDDGDLDLATVHRVPFNDDPYARFGWFENDGASDFTFHEFAGITMYEQAVLLSDVDRNGHLDLLVRPPYPANFEWWTFSAGGEVTKHSTALDPTLLPMSSIDFDQDGDLDIIARTNQNRRLILFDNDGTLQFTERELVVGNYSNLHIADTDRDGDNDILAVDLIRRRIVHLENDGTLQFTTHVILPNGPAISRFVVADIDRDLRLDIVPAHSDSEFPLMWLQADNTGGYVEHVLKEENIEANDVDVADIDGDGDVDIALATSGEHAVVWFENQGQHTFARRNVGKPFQDADMLTFADVNQDGDLDLLVYNHAYRTLDWYENAHERVMITSDFQQTNEPDGAEFSVTFTRTQSIDEPFSLHFGVEGSATVGADYTQSGADSFSDSSGTVEFAAGESERSITFRILDDQLGEGRETITIRLLNTQGYVWDGQREVTASIVDDDPGEFGDAPAPYPTLAIHDGARHAATGPQFGTSRDVEPDGQPSEGASADDADEQPMETGIVVDPIRWGDLQGSATIDVTDAPLGARVDAWIDFDGDGNWGGSGERIVTGLEVDEGQTVIEFPIPSGIQFGETYARFRVSSAGGLAPVGWATDGEVQDIQLTIAGPAPAIAVWNERELPLIPSDCCTPRSPEIVDLDRDGDADIIVGMSSGRLYWYENDGQQNFELHAIDPGIPSVWGIDAVDFDGDADIDIVVVSRNANVVAWYENDGSQEFTIRMIGSRVDEPIGYVGVEVSDLDGDGDLDVVTVGDNDGALLWFERREAHQFERHTLAAGWETYGLERQETPRVQVVDFNDDGALDIVVPFQTPDGSRVILENDGQQNFVPRPLEPGFHGARSFHLADMDQDGDYDAVVHHQDRLAWLELDGYSVVAEHEVDTDPSYGGRIVLTEVVDADGDSDLDVVVVSSRNYLSTGDGDIVLKLFQQDSQTGTFSESTIFANEDAFTIAYVLTTGDVDADGDTDIVTVPSVHKNENNATGHVTWYENVNNRVEITAEDTAVSEHHGTTTVTIARTGELSQSVAVEIELGGNATLGEDFSVDSFDAFDAGVARVVLDAEVASRDISLQALDNAIASPLRSVTLTIRDVGAYELGERTFATISIVDDEPADFGDAPERYDTLLDRDGARHSNSGPTIGETRDAEFDAAASAQADGDQSNHEHDEPSGVEFRTLYVGQLGAEATIQIRNVQSEAWLDAWIDFDQDGSWNGPPEHIARHRFITSDGDHILRFDVPRNAPTGITYARIRVSSTPVAGAKGLAHDGEVEDQAVEIRPHEPIGALFPPRVIYSASKILPHSQPPAIGDFDQDGDLDVVTLEADQVTLLKNDGSGQFTPSALDANTPGATTVAAVDLNGDGFMDVVVASSVQGIIWYENDGSGHFSPHSISNFDDVTFLQFGDVNDDGAMDIFTTENGFVWLENDGSNNFESHRIGRPAFDEFSPLFDVAANLDSDGDLDVIGASPQSPFPLVWHENLGNGQFEVRNFPEQIPTRTVEIADFNNDGLPDIFVSPIVGGPPRILENMGEGQFTPHTMEGVYSGREIDIADVDGDGDFDLFRSGITWIENLGDLDFQVRSIPLGHIAAAASWADLNGDRRPDLIARSRGEGLVVMMSVLQGDVNADNAITGEDLYALSAAILAGTHDETFDLTGDGTVDQSDLDFWITEVWGSLPGDANGDRRVDADDWFWVWVFMFKTTGNYGDGDFNADGITDGRDFNIWNSNKFRVAEGASVSGAQAASQGTQRVPRAAAPHEPPEPVVATIASQPHRSHDQVRRAEKSVDPTRHSDPTPADHSPVNVPLQILSRASYPAHRGLPPMWITQQQRRARQENFWKHDAGLRDSVFADYRPHGP